MVRSGDSDAGSESVTRLLAELRAGRPSALDSLVALVYDELGRLAHAQRERWEGDHTLNSTALLHEAYLKLAGAERPDWENRAHFFSVAARAMRQVLVDYARRKRAEKRGGDRARVTLERLQLEQPYGDFHDRSVDTLLALEESLDRLMRRDARQVHVVECRFFAGMTIQETATALGVSTATVERDWAMAKAWLYRDMQRGASEAASVDG